MTRKIVTVAALAGAGLLATACGTASQQGDAGMSGTTPAPAALGAQPVNPVPILKQAGAKVPPGVKLGDHDAFGNRMAEGTFGAHGWEQITVYTAASPAAHQRLLASGDARPDDYTGVITLPGKRAVVVADAWEDNGPHWAPGGTPAQIGQRVNGQQKG
jgi:hypothetical protein